MPKDPEATELKQMIADYMEQGFLSNIIAMFKSDSSLYDMVGTLLSDERFRVRIGMTALIEELHKTRPDEVRKALPSLLSLLGHESPTVRGDAAYLVGLIGDEEDRVVLKSLLNDPNPQVAEMVRDLLEQED
ncbi:MAG: HEAT repeat domain-containing protein [bacterium]